MRWKLWWKSLRYRHGDAGAHAGLGDLERRMGCRLHTKDDRERLSTSTGQPRMADGISLFSPGRSIGRRVTVTIDQ